LPHPPDFDYQIAGTATIKIQATELTGSLTFDRDVTVTLAGGYDDTFTSSTGWTVISAPTGPALVISNGTVIVEHIIVR